MRPIYPIAPRSEAVRPFWSVMIPVYNRTAYLERTLRSVLIQDPGPEEMQIEVVDDASDQESPQAIVEKAAGDRVAVVRNSNNLGGAANWNQCIERARGHWVHILHSDDVVLPGFYEILREGVEKESTVGAAFCRHNFIDERDLILSTSDLERSTSGILPDFLEQLALSCGMQCASTVVRRSVYENLGGFRTDVPYTLDWEMWLRIAASYALWYEPSILAAFRVHSESWTRSFLRTGANVRGARLCIELTQSLLPADHAHRISEQAMEHVALRAIHLASLAIHGRDAATAVAQLREALKCSRSPSVIRHLLGLLRRAPIMWMTADSHREVSER